MLSPACSWLLLGSALFWGGGILGRGVDARKVASSISSDPSWDETVAEANEVSRLSDEISKMRSKISRWRTRYQKAKAYHEKITKLQKEQIRIRKQQLAQREVTDQDSEAEYRKEQEEHYKYLMCSKLLNAFFFDDKNDDARLEVLHLCMGRKSLGPSSFLSLGSSSSRRQRNVLRRRRKQPPVQASSTPTAEQEGPSGQQRQLLHWPSLDEELEEIGGETKSLVATETRLLEKTGALAAKGSPEMQAKLDALEQEYQTVRAQYSADQAKWRAERAELDKEEDALGADVYQEHYDKTAIKKEAWMKVKDEFCPVINESYRIDEDKIVDHAMEKCA